MSSLGCLRGGLWPWAFRANPGNNQVTDKQRPVKFSFFCRHPFSQDRFFDIGGRVGRKQAGQSRIECFLGPRFIALETLATGAMHQMPHVAAQ